MGVSVLVEVLVGVAVGVDVGVRVEKYEIIKGLAITVPAPMNAIMIIPMVKSPNQ